MKTNLKKLVALFLTLAMVLPIALPVFQVAAAETKSATEGTTVYDFSDESQLADFALYQSSNSQFTVADGYLVPDGTSGEMKALLKETPADIQSISVDIYPGASGLINVGLYVGASGAANGADEINAQAFLIQSDFSGWTDAPNRIDIIHGTFAGSWTELGRTISESGNGNNLFSGGVKQPLNLKLDFTQENIQLTLSLLGDPTKSVQCVYDAADISGQIGFRANASDAKFDNLSIAYTPAEDSESDSQYAYVGNFSQSEEAVNELPEGWVRHPNYKNGTLYQQDGALYFDTKDASGVCAAFYEQDEYTDYLIEADFTMLDRTNDARWMGLAYRASSDEKAINMFFIKYNNAVGLNAYFSTETTCYDGTTMKGWGDSRAVSNTLSATQYPELVDAGKGTVNLKLKVVGNTLTGYVNDVKVLETTTYNATQDSGSFGIVTSNADIKVENYRVTDLTETEQDTELRNAYAYESEFSQQEDSNLPDGWLRHPSYKNGTLVQKNGVLYFNTLDASGICTAYYDQSMYTDYLIEADFTMLDKTDNNRWMGFAYRMNTGETAANMFAIKYNNTATIHSYYGAAVTGYDGEVLSRGWAPNDNIHFVSNTLAADKYPTLVGAGQGTVNLKLAVIGNKLIGFVNDVKVLEAVTHNP